MSDTPRTDAAVALTSLHRYDDSFGDPIFGWVTANFARELERENAALREDKERLDWLGSVKCAYYHEGPCCWRINEDQTTDGETIREAIDAARKEQP